MLAWIANLDFAGGGTASGPGAELLHGTRQTLGGVGCFLPIVMVLLWR